MLLVELVLDVEVLAADVVALPTPTAPGPLMDLRTHGPQPLLQLSKAGPTKSSRLRKPLRTRTTMEDGERLLLLTHLRLLLKPVRLMTLLLLVAGVMHQLPRS